MALFRWARSCNHLSRLGIPTEMEEEVQEYLSGDFKRCFILCLPLLRSSKLTNTPFAAGSLNHQHSGQTKMARCENRPSDVSLSQLPITPQSIKTVIYWFFLHHFPLPWWNRDYYSSGISRSVGVFKHVLFQWVQVASCKMILLISEKFS